MSTELDKYERKRGGARQRGVYLAPKKSECTICHKLLCNISRHMKEVHKQGGKSTTIADMEEEKDNDDEEVAVAVAVVQKPRRKTKNTTAPVAAAPVAAAPVAAATSAKKPTSAAKSKNEKGTEQPKENVAHNDEATPNKEFKSKAKQCPHCLKYFQRVNRHIRDNCHLAPVNAEADADADE